MDYISFRWIMCIAVVTMVAVIAHTVSAAYSQSSSTLSVNDPMDPQNEIITSRTRAYLSCESGEMVVKINFSDPFRGIIYAHLSRDSPCRIFGNDSTYYELKIPLKKCGTWQKSPRVFVNNVTIRFHPALELEEDETKTVVCRYPPPLTPSPGGIIVVPVTLSPGGSTPVNTAGISEVEILSIICVVLFLSLLTLGLGTSYICLKRRNIRLVRRFKATSSGPGSEITKLSGTTTLGNFSIFEPIRIPRAVPYSACGGSEAAILTSTRTSAESGSGPSDYPPSDSSPSTESHDMIDEVDESYVQTLAKRFYDNYGFQEHSGPILTIPKAILRKDTKRYDPPTRDDTAISISMGPRLQADLSQSASTALELDDVNHSVWDPQYATLDAMSTPEPSDKLKKTGSPLYAQVKKKPRVRIMEEAKVLNVNENGVFASDEFSASTAGVARRLEDPTSAQGQRSYDGWRSDRLVPATPNSFFRPARSEETIPPAPVLPTFKTENHRLSRREVNTSSSVHERRVRNIPEYRLGYVASQIAPIPEEDVGLGTSQGEEPQVVSIPKVSVKDIDDVYVTTTVETESRETVTTVKRDVLEKHMKTPTQWNVIIRQRDQTPSVTQDSESDSTAKDESQRTAKVKDETAATGSMSYPSAQNFKVTIRAIPPKDQPHAFPMKSVLGAEELPSMDRARTERGAERPTDPEGFATKTPPTHVTEKAESDPVNRAISHPDDANSKTLTEAVGKSNESLSWPEVLSVIAYVPDSTSLSSTSDSLHSEHSLGERSTSEVMETAPTVRRSSSDIPMLERSTSEILTTPENYSRWSRVPVFENFSPEFLAAIPVLIPEQREGTVSPQPFRPVAQVTSPNSKVTSQKTKAED